jgi:CRISPR system Cascade subunit CasE
MNSPAARKAVSSPAVMHASVEYCFAGDNGLLPDREAHNRKLWRLDQLGKKLYLLMLSPEKPDFAHFSEQYCEEGIRGETRDYEPLLSSIRGGQVWRFRLRGNAVHSVTEEKGRRGKVYAHVTAEQKRGWLIKKAAANGFTVGADSFDVVEIDPMRFWRDRPVTLGVAVFEGTLTVTEPDLFKRALTHGIGRAKAYGCGLLTIANRK